MLFSPVLTVILEPVRRDLTRPKDFADVIKLRTLRERVFPGLSE
jgi:hypothetical protein